MWQEGEGEWAYSCTTLHKASKTLNVCSLRPIAPRFTSGSILHPRVLSSEDKRLVLPALRVRIHYFHTVSTARVSIAVLGKILIISLNWRQPRNVCTRQLFVTEFWWNTHTHTHTHIYIYIYIYFLLFLHVRPANQPTKVVTACSKKDWTPLSSTTRWALSMFVAGHVQLCDAVTVVNKSADYK